MTNPGEMGFCLSLRGSVDKGKEEGGFQDLFTTSPASVFYKLITCSHFPLNNDDYLQINDIAAASVKTNSKKETWVFRGSF